MPQQLALDLLTAIIVFRDGTVLRRRVPAGRVLSALRLTANNGHDYDVPVVRLGSDSDVVIYRETGRRRHVNDPFAPVGSDHA